MKPVHPNEIAAAKGRALANDILSGDLPKVEFETFTPSEWKHAAEIALADDNYEDLIAMRDEEIQNDLEEQAERRVEYSERGRFMAPVALGPSSYGRGRSW